MRSLVHAELVKLHSTRTPAWLLLATLALMVLGIAVSVPSGGATNSVVPLDDPRLLASIIADILGVPQVTMLILGVLTYTQEPRYGTLTSTFLVEPRRHRVLAAKGVALALTGVAVAVITTAVALTTSTVVINARHGNITLGARLWQTVAAAVLVMVLYGIAGLAAGALIPNQIVAIITTLIWTLVAERLLIQGLPRIGKWTPGGASDGVLQRISDQATSKALLGVLTAGLLLVAYTAALACLARIVTPHRDVL
jgi:ABC-2 type transport system permease protein